MNRRHALRLLGGGAGLLVVAACGSKGSNSQAAPTSTSSGNTSATSSTESAESCSTPIPEETAGFPGDGSNGPNALAEDGVVRRDIRSSFGSGSGTADGVPLDVTLTVLDGGTCTPLAGAAVYLSHCDREGRYSMYQDAADANYLRGVQETDADGTVTFTSIFPAAYSGRWPHIHFEVYSSVSDATGGGTPIATSQLAFPEDVCAVVYATDGYEQSVSNLARSSLDSDNVFSDGHDQQLATVTGDVGSGYVATLSFAV